MTPRIPITAAMLRGALASGWSLRRAGREWGCSPKSVLSAARRLGVAWPGRDDPETRSKIGAAHKGKTLSPEHRSKISAAHKGQTRGPLSPETRSKISAARASHTRRREAAALEGLDDLGRAEFWRLREAGWSVAQARADALVGMDRRARMQRMAG
jgi:hypothetical protein